MSTIKVIKTSFAGGEISPFSLGRVDLERYHSCCESMQNYIALIQGGAQRRPGTRFVAAAMGASRLIPFKFSVTTAYVLEFGNKKLRFFKNGAQILSAGVPYEITTPYDTATDSLWNIKFAQFADIMYLVHPNHPPQKLNRLGDTNWVLNQPMFHAPPTHPFDQDISGGTVTLTPAATTGTGILFTASAAGTFLDGDIGKMIVSGAGLAYITAIGGAGATATADIIDDFASTAAIAAGAWKLRGSPQSYASFGTIDGVPHWVSNTKLGTGQILDLYTFKNFPIGQTTPPAQIDSFRAIDVNRYVIVAGCVGQIVSLVSPSHITVRLLSLISATFVTGAGAPASLPISGGAWSVEDNSFSAANGYPLAVCFFQDRLCFAGTTAQPQNLWASVTGDYENFAKGPNDDDGLDEEINSGFRDTIQWMAAYQGQIAVGTQESEFIVTGGGVAIGGNGPAITPSNFTASIQSRYGVASIQPLFVENDLIYVQHSKITGFQFSYDIQRGVYGSKNLNLLSDIITTAGFKEMVYAQIPYRVLWFTDLGGNLVGLTYNREQDIWGWHRHFTGQDLATPDQFVSVCSIPDPTGLLDQVWFCTKRTINGSTVYSIEVMDPTLYVDSAATSLANNPKITSIGGLARLQGRSVYVYADNAVLGPYVVPGSGTVDFHAQMPSGATNVQVGLNYIPYIRTVRPELAMAGQTSQGLIKRWNKIWVRLYNTNAITVSQDGGKVQPWVSRETTDVLGAGVPPETIDVDVRQLQRDRDGRVIIQQPKPGPSTVLAVFGAVEVGEI